MALTPTQEAQVLALIAQEAALLSLAANEAPIISNLGATDVILSDLAAASSVDDTDLLLIRQGTTDKSITGAIVKASATIPDATDSVKGKVSLAIAANYPSASDTEASTPAYVASAVIGVQGAFKALTASATGASANVSISADEVMLETPSNTYKVVRAVSLTLNTAGSGENGLDTGTLAASTWYYLWVINNGTTTSALLSLSSTAPTMPVGYTFRARVGAIRTDGTVNKYPLSFKQKGRNVQYAVASGSNVAAMPRIATSTTSVATTWQALSVSNFVPPTASKIRCAITGIVTTNSPAIAVAPNNQYSTTLNDTTNPAPVMMIGGSNTQTQNFEFELESTNIYWVGNASGTHTELLSCLGWEDNI